MTRLQQTLLRRELEAESKKDSDITEDVEDFAFQKLKKQARNEIRTNLARIIYRAKYNLPPNDPRFLDLTDEEIVYELILQSEYRKFTEDVQDKEDSDDNKVIVKNTDEFESLVKRLEKGEDIDLSTLMLKDEDWEKIDG